MTLQFPTIYLFVTNVFGPFEFNFKSISRARLPAECRAEGTGDWHVIRRCPLCTTTAVDLYYRLARLGPNHKLWIGKPEPDTGSVSKRTPKCICSIAEKYLLK